MPTVTITINRCTLEGYSITIDKFVLALPQGDDVCWRIESSDFPDALISIDPDHRQHFPDLVPGGYGQILRSRVDSNINPHVRFHYKLCIMVNDVEILRDGEKRRGERLVNVICIDPDYKVVP